MRSWAVFPASSTQKSLPMLTKPRFSLLSKVVSGTEVKMVLQTWDKFLERPRKLFYVCRVCIQDLNFNNSENGTMKLSLNEAKLTGLWARNCADIQQVLILKFDFGPSKFPAVLTVIWASPFPKLL